MSAGAASRSARSLDSLATTLLIIVSVFAIGGLGAGVYALVSLSSTRDRVMVSAAMVGDIVAWL